MRRSVHFVWSLLLWLLLIGFWLLPAVAEATMLYTADTTGAVLVQSRRAVKDSERHTWQVIAFKAIQADGAEGHLALRLVGFPEAVAIDHNQPIAFTNWQYQTYRAADISDQISRSGLVQSHVGQYNLQAVLAELPAEPLQLHLVTVDQTEILMPIPVALVQEWQHVAQTHQADVQQTCDRFPREARQNPDFPTWVNCSLPSQPLSSSDQS